MQNRSLLPLALLACTACVGTTTTAIPADANPVDAGDGPNSDDQPGPLALPRLAEGCVIAGDQSAGCFWEPSRTRSGYWAPVRSTHGWLRLTRSLGLQADGGLWCVNYPDAWNCGQDPNVATSSNSFQRLFADRRWRDLATGMGGSCAIDSNAALWCWGDGAPRAQVGVDTEWAQVIDASDQGDGDLHAIDANGQLFAIEHLSGSSWDITAMPTAPGPWLAFADACGVVDAGDANQVLCVQSGTDGLSLVGPVSTGRSWAAAHGSASDGCAVAADGTLWCWGSNAFGQRGNGRAGSAFGSSEPATQVGDSNRWVAVGAPSGGQPCGYQRDADGDRLYCWGANLHGSIAQPAGGWVKPNQLGASVTGAASSWRTATIGGGAACAVGDDTSLWCWGAYDSACALKPNCALASALDYPLTLTPFQAAASGWLDVRISVYNAQTTSFACGLRQGANGNDLWCWSQGNPWDGATYFPTQQLAPGVNWGAFGSLGDTLAVISADGNNLSAIRPLAQTGSPTVQRIPNPTAQGRWIDASLESRGLWAIWRDEVAQPPTQHVYSGGMYQTTAPTLRLDGDWAHLGTLFATFSPRACGVKTDGTLWCLVNQQPQQVPSTSTAPWTSCANMEDAAYCVQGGNLVALAYAGPLQATPVATGISTWQRVVDVEADTPAPTVCGLYLDGAGKQQLTCWGHGSSGELGVNDGVHGPALFYATPQRVVF